MVDLGKERPIFYSEGDFKVALCQKIASSPEINKKYNFKIIAEFPISDADKSIDIVLIDTKNRKYYAIELKYLKQKYGKVECSNEEFFDFTTSDASTEKMFRYYRDIEKLQDLLKKESRFEKAYAILLTNNDFFYDKRYSLKYNCDFTKITYEYKKNNKSEMLSVELNKPYIVEWHQYSDIIKEKDGKNIELKFLINEVKK
jgi:hypothetical protein